MKIQRLLYWQWHSFLKRGVEEALPLVASSVDTFFYQLADWEEDDSFRKKFLSAIENGSKTASYDAVFSINFNPMISEICEEKGILYISWVYDSPIHIRNLEALKNKVNRTFFFDRGEAEALIEQGIPVYHMPLSGDAAGFQRTIRNAASGTPFFASDIAFVGQLYRTEYQYYMTPLTDYQRGFLEGIINSQSKVYGGYLIPELITEEFLAKLNERYLTASKGTAKISRRELLYLLAGEVTGRERRLILSLLSSRYAVDLYSSDEENDLPKRSGDGTGCSAHPYIDYYEKMPFVFSGAKINLNISLKCIRTGVPLRVFDVLSCGGFLITNFQAELPELFEIGSELVCYSSVEELLQLVDFYMKHDEERRRIAENGLRRIQSDHTPERQLGRMFDKI